MSGLTLAPHARALLILDCGLIRKFTVIAAASVNVAALGLAFGAKCRNTTTQRFLYVLWFYRKERLVGFRRRITRRRLDIVAVAVVDGGCGDHNIVVPRCHIVGAPSTESAASRVSPCFDSGAVLL